MVVTMMVTENETSPTFLPGNPLPLFAGPYWTGVPPYPRPFDVSSDNNRLLMIKEDTSNPSLQPQIVVVQHFAEELTRLVPVD